MTYFGLLAVFILPPVLVLAAVVYRRRTPVRAWIVLLAHVALALIYTTPWDNYLVATGVWYYNPRLVTGLRLGWVPLEEYVFFVLQTLLTGLGYLAVQPRLPARADGQIAHPARVRLLISSLLGVLWVASLVLLFSGWRPGTYLALILGWGLLPVLLQMIFGADILLARSQALGITLSVSTIYLWLVDALALAWGTWTIDPLQTTGLKLGVIPLEELLFFLMTNLIVTFGMALMLADQGLERARNWLAKLLITFGKD